MLSMSIGRRHKAEAIWIFGAVVVCSMVSAVIPLILQYVLDSLSQKSSTFIYLLAAMAGFVWLSQCGKDYINGRAQIFVHETNSKLGEEYIKGVLKCGTNTIIDKGAAYTVQALNNAKASNNTLIQSALQSIAPTIFEMAVAISVLLATGNYVVTSVILVYILLFGLISRRFIDALSRVFRQCIFFNMETAKRVNGIVSGIETVKILNAKNIIIEKYNVDNNKLINAWRDFYKKNLSLSLAKSTLFIVIFLGSLWFTGRKVIAGSIGIGEFVMINTYLFQVCRPYESLLQTIGNVIESFAGYKPLIDIIRLSEIDGYKSRNISIHSRPSLKLESICYRYGESEGIDDVSMTFKPGTFNVITGSSGSGKTTLIKLIMRLIRPQSGQVEYGGVNIYNIDDDIFHEKFSLVTQDLGIFNESLEFNLRVANPNASDLDLYEALSKAQLSYLVDRSPEKLGIIVGERGLKLSGGERQRLTIARIFLRNPDVIIFDESTSSLDYKTERYIIEEIKKTFSDKIILMIAHRDSVIDSADNVFTLEKGRLENV